MKVFLILLLIYTNCLYQTNGQCNRFVKIGCKKVSTAAPTTTVKESEDRLLKSSADSVENPNQDDNPAAEKTTEISSDTTTQLSSEEENQEKSTTEKSGESDDTSSKAPEETSSESSSEKSSENSSDHSSESSNDSSTEASADASKDASVESSSDSSEAVGKGPKKSFLSSFASSLPFSKAKEQPVINDKNQELFLKKYYQALADRMKKKDKDVNLKAFKGAAGDQNESDQKETDGFFSQFKNFLGKTCFQNIGCFSATEYNDFANRPIPMLPMSPESISPVFHVYTLESRSIPRNYSYNASEAQLKYSTFNPKLRTALIVHGFQSGYALWMENLKDYVFYRSNDDFNVIVVVWEKGSKVPMYNLAATNTRVVGACIGFFIETLCRTFKMKNDMFYLIGHSLGGHTIGYAGKRLIKPQVARITALDPAGVGFHFTNPAMRLDSTDASMVTAIHTDGALIFSEGFGTQDTLGHYDFYPNGGTWQPGCPESGSVAQKLGSITSGKDITCSHSRACLIINNLDKPEDECQAVAYQCPSYEVFLEGRCADCSENKCELMGLNPDYWLTNKPNNKTINKKYYINTSHKEDYCLQHYQFAFHMTNDSDSITGTLHMKLKYQVDSNGTKELDYDRIITKSVQKKIHTLLVNFEYKIEKIIGMEVMWKRYNPTIEKNRINRGFKLKIPYIEINYMSHIDPSKREAYSSILCASNPSIVANKGKTVYEECKPELKDRGTTTTSEKLEAMEWRQDIYAVDIAKEHKVFHKIPGTRIKEVVDKNQKVI